MNVNEAANLLERHDKSKVFSGSAYCNNIWVRCNEQNLGASASRNRGIEESTGDYILFLDDDVIPSKDLLHSYGRTLQKNKKKKKMF